MLVFESLNPSNSIWESIQPERYRHPMPFQLLSHRPWRRPCGWLPDRWPGRASGLRERCHHWGQRPLPHLCGEVWGYGNPEAD